MLPRGSGVLLPIFSLPSKYGIGTFGKEAYKFVDFLKATGQNYWQLLPLGHTSYGDSPYSSFSVYAGNPYFIDLDILAEEGFIEESDLLNLDYGDNEESIDYEKLFNNRYRLLKKAYIAKGKTIDLSEFSSQNKWLLDYALFMSLKYRNNQLPWYKWDEKLIRRDSQSLQNTIIELNSEINFWVFLQYLFFKQYFMLKDYANKSGILIIGDMPIYVSEDSVDAWIGSKLFLKDENFLPRLVAGVPPDYFSKEGQLWGNPVYNWEYLKESKYEWWIERISFSFKLYDSVRIDHFRAFDEFWAVAYGSESAINGHWYPAYGKELFLEVYEKLGKLSIIAEDLGLITDSVVKLRKDLGFPGMKVLQFAFDGNLDNPYLPSNYDEDSIAYTGTHDNNTLKGWFESLDNIEKQNVLRLLNINEGDSINKKEDDIIYELIKSLYRSKANICIIPLQDLICLDSKARINSPSTVGQNWLWRIKGQLTEEVLEKIRDLGRLRADF